MHPLQKYKRASLAHIPTCIRKEKECKEREWKGWREGKKEGRKAGSQEGRKEKKEGRTGRKGREEGRESGKSQFLLLYSKQFLISNTDKIVPLKSK